MYDIIKELRYRAYRAQREAHQEKDPGSWAKIFGPDAAEFEERYQGEQEALAAAEWLYVGPPYDDEWYESNSLGMED